MTILIDTHIRELCVWTPPEGEQNTLNPPPGWRPMLDPFIEGRQGDDIISCGLSHAGYDLRLGKTVLIFKNSFNEIINPKKFKNDPVYFNRIFDKVTDIPDGEPVILPPQGYILGNSMEHISMPNYLKGTCVGKCLSGNTRVFNPATGDYARIADISGGEIATVAFGHSNKIETRSTNGGRINNGCQPTSRLHLRSGIFVDATNTHPFMVNGRGWTALKDIEIGDRLMVPGSLPFFGSENMPTAEVKLLALMLADGQCGARSPVYTKHDPRLVKMLKWAAKSLLGCETVDKPNHAYRVVNHKGTGGDWRIPNKLASLLSSHGIDCHSRDKTVPEAVFRLPKEKLSTFLRVLFSGDGSVWIANKSRRTPNVVVEYSSASRRLIEDIHHLLLRFGIRGNIRPREVKGRIYHSFTIRSKANLARFFDSIGFVEGCFKDTFYKESASRYIGPLSEAESTTWDTVVEIEGGLTQPVFDLEVPEFHNFVANDTVVHNSTLARSGVHINTTPIEPGWEGYLTLEIANHTPCPVMIFVGEGIAQLEFHTLSGVPSQTYAQKGEHGGKYQHQGEEPVPPRVVGKKLPWQMLPFVPGSAIPSEIIGETVSITGASYDSGEDDEAIEKALNPQQAARKCGYCNGTRYERVIATGKSADSAPKILCRHCKGSGFIQQDQK